MIFNKYILNFSSSKHFGAGNIDLNPMVLLFSLSHFSSFKKRYNKKKETNFPSYPFNYTFGHFNQF